MPIKPPVASRDKSGASPAAVAESLETRRDKYKHLYYTNRWRNPKTGLRVACLRKHPTCADPFNIGCHQPATVADHKIDHEGNLLLFFDFNNLQGLCEQCHNAKTGSSHRRGVKKLPCLPTMVDGRIQ